MTTIAAPATRTSTVKVIWKYTLLLPLQTIDMPAGTVILHVGKQKHEICLWAMIDPFENAREIRTFHVVPTGTEAWVTPAQHLGTITELGDWAELVMHVFEVPTA